MNENNKKKQKENGSFFGSFFYSSVFSIRVMPVFFIVCDWPTKKIHKNYIAYTATDEKRTLKSKTRTDPCYTLRPYELISIFSLFRSLPSFSSLHINLSRAKRARLCYRTANIENEKNR